jgi:hypothetical protein
MTKRLANFQNNNPLLKFAGVKENGPRNVLMKYTGGNKNTEDDNTDENVSIKNIPMIRKNRNNLKNLENSKDLNPIKTKDTDIPIVAAIRQDIGESKNLNIIKDVNDEDADSDEEDTKIEVLYESYLHKVTNSKKLKQLYFRLIHKDIYYYKNDEEAVHKGMHNLSGVFIREENKTTIDGNNFFCFSVVYPKKTRMYYCDNENDYINWVRCLKKATGYAILTDIYDVRV